MFPNRGLQCYVYGDGIWIEYYIILNDDGSLFVYQWYIYKDKCSDGKIQMMRQACVFLNQGPVLVIRLDFIIGTYD